MTFDELPSAWHEHHHHAPSPEERQAAMVRLCRRVERVGGSVTRRDLVETIAAVAVIFLFGGAAVSVQSPLSRIGAGFLVLWALFVIYTLHRTRMIQQPAPLDAPVTEFCRIELARLDRQIQLLRRVLWWYIAPPVLGANAVFAGEAGFGVAALVYGMATLLLAWGLYALNMRAVARHLVPPRDELANLLRELNQGDVA